MLLLLPLLLLRGLRLTGGWRVSGRRSAGSLAGMVLGRRWQGRHGGGPGLGRRRRPGVWRGGWRSLLALRERGRCGRLLRLARLGAAQELED